MNTKVTICLATFNSSSTIGETLNSLEAQTYKDFSLVVFDNASTDNTLEIVNSYKDKFKDLQVERSDENLGAEGNFTRCLQYTNVGLMAIYHADDIYHPQIIEQQVQALTESNLVAVSTRAQRIDWEGKSLGLRFLPPELKGQETAELNFDEFLNLIFKYGNFVVCPSVMGRAEVMKKEIKIWNGEKFKTSADLDIWFRLSKLGNFGVITRPLISYREAQASTSFRLKKVRKHRHDMFLVLDQFSNELSFEQKEYYAFLENKDLALRVKNGLRDRVALKNFRPWRLKFFKFCISSSFHRNFYIKILVIWSLYSMASLFA